MKKAPLSGIAKNTVYSIASQLLSLAVSLLMGFILPKYIDEYQYAYKQIFALYIGYLGVLHFGLLDGIMLRYAQYDYDELDRPRMRSQFFVLLSATTAIALGGILFSAFFLDGVPRGIVMLLSVGVVTKNIFTYASYGCQMTNQIRKYAGIVMIQRVTYAAMVLCLILCRHNDYFLYCAAEIVGDLVGIACAIFLTRGLYIGRAIPPRAALGEAWTNLSAGFFLMIANFSAILLVGSAKMVIQWRWDELVFGKAAYSFTLTSLFLTFVSAISVVLFPSLKRMDPEELPRLYQKLRSMLSPFLFTVMLGYFPVAWLLPLWLPKYAASIGYLGALLPVIVFTSKATLLTDNYLKAYRRERWMLVINLASIALGMAAFLVSAYVFGNMEAILYLLVFVSMLRSFVSEIAVMRVTGEVHYREFLLELVMTLTFLLSARLFSLWLGCLVYLVCVAFYLLWYRKELAVLLSRFLHRKAAE